MQTALLRLGEDFLTAIVFLVLYFASGNLALAVAVAIAIGIAQFALLYWRGRTIDVMQYLSIGLVIVLGAISLWLDDPRFVLLKPSAVHFAIAAVMLRRGRLARYMPPIVTQNLPESIITATGYAWAALMTALGLTNIYVASEATCARPRRHEAAGGPRRSTVAKYRADNRRRTRSR